jgi:hypothetical protein
VSLTSQAVYSGEKGLPSTLGRSFLGTWSWSDHDEDEKISAFPGFEGRSSDCCDHNLVVIPNYPDSYFI